ncbi:hypothetical protein BC834DRAFT_844990 [Gloeopeniophorella convolvens]|nr:hypothetical protein BC834DRAFT_844990 [Gloeopeniophorella convolvens]
MIQLALCASSDRQGPQRLPNSPVEPEELERQQEGAVVQPTRQRPDVERRHERPGPALEHSSPLHRPDEAPRGGFSGVNDEREFAVTRIQSWSRASVAREPLVAYGIARSMYAGHWDPVAYIAATHWYCETHIGGGESDADTNAQTMKRNVRSDVVHSQHWQKQRSDPSQIPGSVQKDTWPFRASTINGMCVACVSAPEILVTGTNERDLSYGIWMTDTQQTLVALVGTPGHSAAGRTGSCRCAPGFAEAVLTPRRDRRLVLDPLPDPQLHALEGADLGWRESGDTDEVEGPQTGRRRVRAGGFAAGGVGAVRRAAHYVL